MVKTRGLKGYSDVHQTRRAVARQVVRHFLPTGTILEPFRGAGAFFDALPRGTLWCEVERGRDFFDWRKPVDWIVTNPPFSNLTAVMDRCFDLADRTVLLIPISKLYSSEPRLELVRKKAGLEEQFVLGTGREIGFDLGFPFAAMLFTKGYRGPTRTVWGR